MWAEERRAYETSSSYYNLNFGGRVGDVNGDGIDDFCIAENGYRDHTSSPPGNLYIIAGSDVPNGIKEDASASVAGDDIQLAISPNPSSSVVNVSYTLPSNGSLQLKLYDINGEEILSGISEKDEGAHTELIDLRALSLSSGVYLVSLHFTGGGKELRKSTKIQFVK